LEDFSTDLPIELRTEDNLTYVRAAHQRARVLVGAE
jgi:hypothetical protein